MRVKMLNEYQLKKIKHNIYNRIWYIYTTECYLAIKMNEVLNHATTEMNI